MSIFDFAFWQVIVFVFLSAFVIWWFFIMILPSWKNPEKYRLIEEQMPRITEQGNWTRDCLYHPEKIWGGLFISYRLANCFLRLFGLQGPGGFKDRQAAREWIRHALPVKLKNKLVKAGTFE